MADAAVPGRRPPPPPPPPAAAVATRPRDAADLTRALDVAVGAALTASGCVFAAVGLVDVGTAETLASNVFGAILVLVGCALTAAAFGFRARRSWAGAAGAAAAVPATAIGLYLSLNAWEEEPVWGLVFGLIAAGCLAAGVAVIAACRPRFGVKSASILSVAGFVLGFFQFTYAESARVRVGSTLTMSTDLAPAGDEPLKAVAATIKAVNPTSAKIQSLGSLYVVEGVRLCRGDRQRDPLAHFDEVFAQPGAERAFAPRVSERDVVTIQAGKLFDDRTYFEPGEEIVRRFSVPIPKGKYDLVRLRVTLAVANGDRLQLDDVVEGPTVIGGERRGVTKSPTVAGGARGVKVRYQVSERSLVDRIAHGDRVVEVIWESGTQDVRPKLWASALVVEAADEEADRSTSYGIAYTSASTELPLERAKKGRSSRAGAMPRAAAWPPIRFEDGRPVVQPPGPGTVVPPTPAPVPTTPTPTPRAHGAVPPSTPAVGGGAPPPVVTLPTSAPWPEPTSPKRDRRRGPRRQPVEQIPSASPTSCAGG